MGHKQAGDSRPGETYQHPDPVTDEALDWFMRLREENDPDTMAEFERWRKDDPQRVAAFARLSRLHAMPSLRKATEKDAERLGVGATAPVVVAMPPRMRAARRWVSALSAIAAMLLVAVGWQQYPALMLHWRSDYMTATGEHLTVPLPDGSAVTLNTASAIAIDFAGGRRRVSLLEGEAYFDVRHDAAHPFVVAGHFSEVEVKGTAFGVRTDEQEDLVVLERGRVEVRRTANKADLAMLEPRQMIVATASGLSPVHNADPMRSLAWRDGRIVFHDRPFRRALADLERYYDGTVVVMTGQAGKRMVSGNYRIDDPEAAIRTLATSAGLAVTRLPGGILILR
ncbi:FecR domain-containing protein [Mesorhizobium sp. RMAD-H1]|uniref:FecR family protein n=1 Tax=Mesorhizobium sp. RMAD-H1 TaxID=2587065 RepID=UPI001613C277|nr:FecR domain-containing protein [Mesorhizobium sp. RMAD-H1]MBB2973047.1 transmembrane sensor [Mesorhizobium sp. RMAD-H1]